MPHLDMELIKKADCDFRKEVSVKDGRIANLSVLFSSPRLLIP